ncbi:MAG: gamma-glutamyltransferase [Azospirillaceae bacterium]
MPGPHASPRRRPVPGRLFAAALIALALAAALVLAFAGMTDRAHAAEPSDTDGGAMIAAADPRAVEAGLAILRAGGTAADAAVAVQAVLTLVEPQSSGLGGGAFAVHYDAGSGTVTTYDGRETAPMAADASLFLEDDGRPMAFLEAVTGGRSVGTPGTVRLLERLHADHGVRPWESLFADAAALARDGFRVSPRLAGYLASPVGNRLRADPAASAVFFADGDPPAAGDRLANPALAETFSRLAEDGPDAFYEGPIADAVVAAVRDHPTNLGLMTAEDLAAYRAMERAPVCVPYRARRVCGMGPPSSGGIAIGQILTLLAHEGRIVQGPDSAMAREALINAMMLAYADRSAWLGDADIVEVPVDGLLDPRYLARRHGLIATGGAIDAPAPAGLPPGAPRHAAPAESEDRAGTSHISIRDAAGNMLSMTGSIEGPFGAGIMAAGFMLNNELTDFDFLPLVNGRLVPNRVGPGKRPLSSMSPTLVLDADGRAIMAVGSPGGRAIIGYTAQTLVALLDWDLPPAAAVAVPHVLNLNGPTYVEVGADGDRIAESLAARGHRIERTDRLVSGLNILVVTPDGAVTGAADPRREGVARAP